MEQEKTAVKASPDKYINTGRATLLAVIKLMEALAGLYLIYYIITVPDAVKSLVQNFYEGLSLQGGAESAFGSTYTSLLDMIRIILVFELLLIVLDGFASFFTRTAHKGAGLVKVCHRVRFVISVIGFVFLFVVLFQYIRTVIETSQKMKQMGLGDVFSFLGSYQLILYLIVIVGAYWILVDYDMYVARVMKQVSREVRAGEILPMKKKNRLGRESAWLCGILTASVVLSVVALVGGDGILASVAYYAAPVQLLYRGSNAVSIAAAAVLAFKFFLVNRCSADFDHAH